MKEMNIKFITRTAIILALTVAFQSVGRFIPLGPNSQFVVGPLVNACLVIATVVTGIVGGGIVALATPFVAILTGAAMPLPFAPFVGLGNFVLVLFTYIFRKKLSLGIVSGSVLKFGFLFASVNLFVRMMGLPEKNASMMVWTFSWPQLVTALVGGFIGIAVSNVLVKSIKD